jgi:isochorismate synthase
MVSTTAAITPADPLAVFASGAKLARERFLWSCPSLGYELAGIGAAWTIDAAGPARFAEARRAWDRLRAEAITGDLPDAIGTGPLLLGGFSFDPATTSAPQWREFPDALLTVPRYTVASTDGACWLTITAVLEPGAPEPDFEELLAPLALLLGKAAVYQPQSHDNPLTVEDALPADEWQAIVRTAIERMGSSDIEKVVLARECRVRAARPLDRAATLARLRADYPGCFIYAVDRGPSCFLGASPERLVRLRRGDVLSTCLAGSIARGATLEEDTRLGQELLASTKDRHEHEVVVRGLRDALAPVCRELSVPAAPTLMKVRNVQHLFTPVTGQVAPGQTVLDLVERLHPTPAVGGLPREEAMALIRDVERMDRGWYAAPVGWMDTRGDGEFAVALRCGLVRAQDASLFAGCGIVSDSDPEREYAESRLKLRPMLSALGGTR